MPKPWMMEYLKTPNISPDENQEAASGAAIRSPGRDQGVASPDTGIEFAVFGETRTHVNPSLFEQVPRIDTTVNAEPDAAEDADDIGALRDDIQSGGGPTVKGKPRWGTILKPGPIDPLTQNADPPTDYGMWLGSICSRLDHLCRSLDTLIVVERCKLPVLPAHIRFDGLVAKTMVAGIPCKAWCQIEAKAVPFLQFTIQNNSSNPLYVDFDKQANAGSLLVPAGGHLESVTMCDTVSFYVVTGTPMINGQQATANIVFRAWTNPEWRNMWGQ